MFIGLENEKLQEMKGTGGAAHVSIQSLAAGEGPNLPQSTEHRYSYFNMMLGITTNVKGGPGFLKSMLCDIPPGAGFILNDNTAASGTVIDYINDTANTSTQEYNCEFFTGLQVTPIGAPVQIPNVLSSTASHLTFGFAAAHGLKIGHTVVVAGATPAGYNGTWIIYDTPTPTTFRVASTLNPGVGTVFGTTTPFGSVTISYR